MGVASGTHSLPDEGVRVGWLLRDEELSSSQAGLPLSLIRTNPDLRSRPQLSVRQERFACGARARDHVGGAITVRVAGRFDTCAEFAHPIRTPARRCNSEKDSEDS